MTTTVFTTILVALITAVLGPIIVAWFKLKMEKKSQNTLMFDALETSTLGLIKNFNSSTLAFALPKACTNSRILA